MASSSAGAHGALPPSSVSFNHIVTIKLDDSNFRSWRQQIEGVVRTHPSRSTLQILICPKFLFAGLLRKIVLVPLRSQHILLGFNRILHSSHGSCLLCLNRSYLLW